GGPAELDAYSVCVTNIRNTDWLSVARGTPASPCEVKLVVGRIKNGSQRDHPVRDEGDGDAVVRDAAGEIGRTVDGIHHPDLWGENTAGFLAEKTILGKRRLKAVLHQFLHRRVRCRQEVLRPLHAVGKRLSAGECALREPS